MKKLGKLSINPEKIIQNEELINFKGGYGAAPCTCTCFDQNKFVENPDEPLDCLGYVFTFTDCVSECQEFYGMHATGECGNNSLCG